MIEKESDFRRNGEHQVKEHETANPVLRFPASTPKVRPPGPGCYPGSFQGLSAEMQSCVIAVSNSEPPPSGF